MLDADAAMLKKELERERLRVDALVKRLDLLETSMRSLQQASQRQSQAIRAGRPPGRE